MPFKETDSIHLDEILDAARRLDVYVRRSSEARFLEDEVIYDAVCMNLLRIGEGARLLSEEAKAEARGIPWPDVINLRHRIAHGYAHLRASIIWQIAAASVPSMVPALQRLRARLS